MSNLFTKDLNTTLESIIGKAKKRREKIQAKITSLENEIRSCTEKIDSENSRFVQCELDEDQAGQAQCKKNLTVLRKKKQESEGILKAYKIELNKPIGTDEIQKIRLVALKERDTRIATGTELQNKKADIKAQIKQLEKEIKGIDSKLFMVNQDRESQTLYNSGFLEYVDPQAKQINGFGRKMDYIRQWLQGPIPDTFFADHNGKSDEFQGLEVTTTKPLTDSLGNDTGERYMTTTISHMDPDQWLGAWKLQNPNKQVVSFTHGTNAGGYDIHLKYKEAK